MAQNKKIKQKKYRSQSQPRSYSSIASKSKSKRRLSPPEFEPDNNNPIHIQQNQPNYPPNNSNMKPRYTGNRSYKPRKGDKNKLDKPNKPEIATTNSDVYYGLDWWNFLNLKIISDKMKPRNAMVPSTYYAYPPTPHPGHVRSKASRSNDKDKSTDSILNKYTPYKKANQPIDHIYTRNAYHQFGNISNAKDLVNDKLPRNSEQVKMLLQKRNSKLVSILASNTKYRDADLYYPPRWDIKKSFPTKASDCIDRFKLPGYCSTPYLSPVMYYMQSIYIFIYIYIIIIFPNILYRNI